MNDYQSPLQRALDLTANKFIQACAGAGKTFALAKRYCAILDDFARRHLVESESTRLGVENILVITFTRKASAEMAERIYQDLNRLLDGQNLEDLEEGISLGQHLRNAPVEYKMWLRASFSHNYISTIDSFCARILREFAYLHDKDPNFELEEEYQTEQDLQEALDRFLKKKSRSWDSDLNLLLDISSLSGVKNFFKYLYIKKSHLIDWRERFQQLTETAIGNEWLEKYTPVFDTEWLLKEMQELTSFLKCSFKDSQDSARIFLSNLASILNSFNDSLSVNERRWEIVNKILPLFLTKEMEYKKSFPGNRTKWCNPSECDEYKEKCLDLIAKLRIEIPAQKIVNTPTEEDFRAIPVLQALVRLFSEFIEVYQQQKHLQGRHSFEEVIEETFCLLQENPAVCQTLSHRFQHILIDEFQDTNDLRWEIIKLILADKNGDLRSRGVFIVGDKKQSIYGFNQAEVEVMEHAKSALIRKADTIENIIIEFNQNFRSSQEYINFVINPLFGRIMPGEGSLSHLQSYETHFSPTEYGIKSESNERERIRIAECTPICLDLQATIREESDNNFYYPAYHTALIVKEFLEWGEKCDIAEIPVVAVLLRKFTKIGYYFQAFQNLDIPFEVIGGRGLFQQQEACDLFHLLSILLNPLDDLALVGLLRSPLFALSDEEILQVMSEGFKEQKAKIAQWAKLAKTLPLDRLIQKIRSEEQAEFGYFSELNGPQRIGNLDRLLSFFHSLSLQGKTLREVFEHFKFMMENVDDAPQADLPSSAKAQIMTIHKAKGLQFPAVIIPEMNGLMQSDKTNIMHGKIDGSTTEIGIILEDEEGASVKTGLLKALQDFARRKVEAEELRVFYVAVTRAKYRCALLADFKKEAKESQNWWNKYIRDYGFIPVSFNFEEWDNYSSPETKTEVQLLSTENLRSRLSHYFLKEIPTIEWRPPPEIPPSKRYWEVDTHDIVNSVYPYFEEGGRDSQFTPREKAWVGNLFHKAVEKGFTDSTQCREYFAKWLEEEKRDLRRKEIISEAIRLFNKYRHSKIFQVLASLPPEATFKEHPLCGWIDNGDLYLEVKGRMDILYRQDGGWRVLDFKTDNDTKRLPAYRLQIQTYLWCLKQVYGLEAVGEIYFVNSDQLFSAKWDDDYFGLIFPGEKSPFKFSQLFSAYNRINLSAIESVINSSSGEQLVILNQTKQQARDLYRALLASGRKLSPNITSTTLDELIINEETEGKKISPELAETMVEKILTKEKLHPPLGFIHTLTEAILENEEWGKGLIEKYEEIERKFYQFKKSKVWSTDVDIISDIGGKLDFHNKTLVLNGFYEFKPLRIDLVKKLSLSAKRFYFVDNLANDEVSQFFTYDNSIWERKAQPLLKTQRLCEMCFSAEEEVETLARDILTIPSWEDKMKDIKIVVTSMERYVPLIKRIFPGYGIPTRVFKNEPLLERPIAQLLLGLLDIMEEFPRLEWGTVTRVWLHPLMEPDDSLWKFDKWIRQTGEHLYNLEEWFEQNPGKTIKEELELADRGNLFQIQKKLLKFVDNHRLQQKIANDDVSQKALARASEVIEWLPQLYEMVDLKGDLSAFKQKLRTILTTEEIPTLKQERGIEVLGTLASAHLQPEYLFVLGMVEKDFPRSFPSNPFLKSATFNTYFCDLALFHRWLNLSSEVKFYCPERDEQGNSLQSSTFIEALQIIPHNREGKLEVVKSQRELFRQYYGKRMVNTSQEKRLIRHNAYLEPALSEYRGKVSPQSISIIRLSASTLDQLLRCPMKYWFSTILKLKPLDFDEEREEPLQIGNILHQTLNNFGTAKGFEILKKDFTEACRMLSECLLKVLKDNYIDLEKDLIASNRYKYYYQGLNEGRENNLLVRLLEWNRSELENFQPLYFEKRFGDQADSEEEVLKGIEISSEEFKLCLNGKIDKILVNEEEQMVLATDYKTGRIDKKEITDNWSTQFPVYYLALLENFPGRKVLLAYEQIKSLRKGGNGLIPIEELETMDMVKLRQCYLELAGKIRRGEFHLTDREISGKACEHCDYSGICRKSSVKYLSSSKLV